MEVGSGGSGGSGYKKGIYGHPRKVPEEERRSMIRERERVVLSF